MKKVLTLLFALALFSCRPVVNQPTSKSSASDSVELKKQEAWESVHRLDSVEDIIRILSQLSGVLTVQRTQMLH